MTVCVCVWSELGEYGQDKSTTRSPDGFIHEVGWNATARGAPQLVQAQMPQPGKVSRLQVRAPPLHLVAFVMIG